MKDFKFSKAWSFYKKNSWKIGVLFLVILLFGFFIKKIELNTNYVETYGKIYEVKQLMGGVSSFPLEVLKKNKFSEYFEGYGLYEDADYTFRISKLGQLYIHTGANLAHHHDASGRPNQYHYGKMVTRNGWYVWRVMHPKPGFINIIKWYAISSVLTLIRFVNVVTTTSRKQALTEALGRTVGLFSLLLSKPR